MKGFTLIELLIVVLIVGILATVALPQYQKVVARARLTEAYTTIGALRKAEEIYYVQHSTWAEDVESLDIELAPLSTRTYGLWQEDDPAVGEGKGTIGIGGPYTVGGTSYDDYTISMLKDLDGNGHIGSGDWSYLSLDEFGACHAHRHGEIAIGPHVDNDAH